MKNSNRSALALGLAFAATAIIRVSPAAAQDLAGARLKLHPVTRVQTGIVTEVSGDTAWVRFHNNVRKGAVVEFALFSEGSPTMASGQIVWVAPVAPFEALVANVQSAATVERSNDLNGVHAPLMSPTARIPLTSIPLDDANGSFLAAGAYAHALMVTAGDDETLEPVRANITALRERKNHTAALIAAAAEQALVADATDTDTPAEYAVNYTILAERLRPYRSASLTDTVTERLVHRLYLIAAYHNGVGGTMSADALMPPSAQK